MLNHYTFIIIDLKMILTLYGLSDTILMFFNVLVLLCIINACTNVFKKFCLIFHLIQFFVIRNSWCFRVSMLNENNQPFFYLFVK